MENRPDLPLPQVDPEYLKKMLNLSPAQRLEALTQLMEFLYEAMPDESKQNWEELRKRGF